MVFNFKFIIYWLFKLNLFFLEYITIKLNKKWFSKVNYFKSFQKYKIRDKKDII